MCNCGGGDHHHKNHKKHSNKKHHHKKKHSKSHHKSHHSSHHKNDKCKKLIKDFAPATYTLVQRQLADSTVLSGAGVTGTISFSESGLRVMDILIKYPDNTFFTAAVQSKFKFTKEVFDDELIAMTLQLNGPNQPLVQTFEPLLGQGTVSCEDKKLVITNPPVDPVQKFEFSKEGFVAYAKEEAGGFIDTWKRVD